MKRVWTCSNFQLLVLGLALQPLRGAGETAFPARAAAVVKNAVVSEAQSFDLSAVRLLESPFKQAMEKDQEYLLHVDPKRLLAFFQKYAGLFKGDIFLGYPAIGLGGGPARAALGHYLSACSAMYRSTGDERFQQRVAFVIEELTKCQNVAHNRGLFIDRGEPKAFAQIAAGQLSVSGIRLNGRCVPFYEYHKLMAGLFDAHDLCGNASARRILLELTAWCEDLFKNLNDAQIQSLLSVEHGGMAEVLANVYSLTGEPRHLALARKFKHREIFDPLVAGADPLDGRHANTQIPKFVGYQRLYELTGEAPWSTAARNFWKCVAVDRSFANGGNSLHEGFHPMDRSEEAMHVTGGPETCNTYNMLKLTRRLFAEKPDAAQMDFYEKALYNQILPSQHPRLGGFTYFQAMVPGAYRTYSDVDFSWWCCVGTGMENHAGYAAPIYAHCGERLFVNLFIPSELRWIDQGATITQTTAFPDESSTKLHFQLAAPRKFTLAVRYPHWVAPGALKLKINGQAMDISAQPGSYAEITREWQDGDALSVELPMSLRTEMLPRSNSFVALEYGPILLAARIKDETLRESDFHGPHHTIMPASRKIPCASAPAIVVPITQWAEHLERIPGQSLGFKTRGLCKPDDVTLVPLNRIFDERYAMYFRLRSLPQWEEDKALWAAEEQRQREIEAATSDQVQCGRQHSELDHAMRGEKTLASLPNARMEIGRTYREATGGGWFSYDLKVDPASPMALICTYWGGDKARSWDVLVDGKLVGSEEPAGEKPGEFLTKTYAIPVEITQGKSLVSVKFQARKNRIAGAVFEARMIQKP